MGPPHPVRLSATATTAITSTASNTRVITAAFRTVCHHPVLARLTWVPSLQLPLLSRTVREGSRSILDASPDARACAQPAPGVCHPWLVESTPRVPKWQQMSQNKKEPRPSLTQGVEVLYDVSLFPASSPEPLCLVSLLHLFPIFSISVIFLSSPRN